ncbi:MAG: hypothetical protein KIT69_07445 [Propionibacteriaceae bacterium]|nr:hypothetical protein [Propionibacteriaceae bacterium]
MSGFFAARNSVGDPWFRIGRLEVGTVMAVVLSVVASWLAYVIFPLLPSLLAYVPGLVVEGQVWRLVAWPMANGLGLWGIISLFFFWYFGTDLEQVVGRKPMAWLLVGIWASLTGAATVVSVLLGEGYALAGFGIIQFAVLLIWIAEYPDRRFLFNIPAWIFGLVLVALQVLQALAMRDLGGLLSLALGLVLIAIAARRAGLLTAYKWIPGARTRPKPREVAVRPRTTRASARQASRATSDRERLDELLDLINERGIGSLTDSQRKELMRLRERLRRD